MGRSREPDVEKGMSAYGLNHKFKWYERYKASIKFNGSLTSTSSFDDYEKNRIKDVTDFKDIKAPDGTSLSEKLNPADPASIAIATALASPDLDKARNQFSAEFATLNIMVSAVRPEFSPGELGTYLLDIRNDAVRAINAQHNQATTNLNNLFDQDDFKTNLMNRLGCTAEDLPAVKDEMLAAIDKSTQEERAKLEKMIGDNATELFYAGQDEFERITYTTKMYNRNKIMRDEINRQIAEHEQDEGASISYNTDTGLALFKNVDLKKLEHFFTYENVLFQPRDIIKNSDGSFSMQLNPLYQSETSKLEDMTSFAEGLRACGYKQIILRINNNDPKKAEEDARIAMRAAVAAGYNPKDVTIEVNGEVKMKYNAKEGKYTNKDLFKERPQLLKSLEDIAINRSMELDSRIRGNTESNARIKARAQEIRAQNQPPAPPEPGPGPGIGA